MAKLEVVPGENGSTEYHFYCPGCRMPHAFIIGNGRRWTFDGNLEQPTFHPSLNVKREPTDKTRQTKICHSFVEQGVIKFLGDCTHELAGQAVELPEIPW